MAKKARTKAEQEDMSLIASIGCIVEINHTDEWGFTNKVFCGKCAELHHPLDGVGIGEKSSDKDVIPLCPEHHRTGGLGVAIHAGQESWERKFGTEAELLIKRNELLGRY